ncbi:MAG: crotonase/enoyl-CoA hydratase family protein [Myxococcales bacterium]|nr:crotonase/enoyl-CoA hydratase family protein [Myxococcales bacterium]
MTAQDFASLRVDKAGGVGHVVLKNGDKGNLMGMPFFLEVPQAFETLDADPEVRVILLRSEGKAFTYGLDLMGMAGELGPFITGDNQAASRTKLLRLIEKLQHSFNAIAACTKPVIAAIQRQCIGGGLDMIAACDIRICSADAMFSLRETRMGIVADLGSLQRLPSIIGDGYARELAFTGRDVDAEEALRCGLVTRVLPSHEALIVEAEKMAEQIASNPPLVVQGTKQVMDFSRGKPVSAGLDYVAAWNAAFLQSEDFREAIEAFMQKRAPKFVGR